METAIVLLAVAGFMFYAGRKKLKETSKLKEMGFDLDNKTDAGKYIAGHPDIDKPSEKMSIVLQQLKLFQLLYLLLFLYSRLPVWIFLLSQKKHYLPHVFSQIPKNNYS